MSQSQYCTFFIDGLEFAVATDAVQEVLRRQMLTPVPRVSRAIRGLINLRGSIVTAIDMRARLDLPAGDEVGDVNLIVRCRGEAVSLLVDSIGDVVDLDGESVEAVPVTIPRGVRDVLTGVVDRPGRPLLLLVDPAKAVGPAEQRATAS